jgi:hypothetical protein
MENHLVQKADEYIEATRILTAHSAPKAPCLMMFNHALELLSKHFIFNQETILRPVQLLSPASLKRNEWSEYTQMDDLPWINADSAKWGQLSERNQDQRHIKNVYRDNYLKHKYGHNIYALYLTCRRNGMVVHDGSWIEIARKASQNIGDQIDRYGSFGSFFRMNSAPVGEMYSLLMDYRKDICDSLDTISFANSKEWLRINNPEKHEKLTRSSKSS